MAQQVPVLERTVILTAQDERLDSFLKRLSHEAGCVFSYSASANQVNKGNVEALNLVNRVYTGLDFQVARKFALYAGPTLSIRVYDTTFNNHPVLFTYYTPTIQSERTYPQHDLATQVWWGFRAGIRFF